MFAFYSQLAVYREQKLHTSQEEKIEIEKVCDVQTVYGKGEERKDRQTDGEGGQK